MYAPVLTLSLTYDIDPTNIQHLAPNTETMDPILTWEILSRLTRQSTLQNGTVVSNNSTCINELPPFFAQRQAATSSEVMESASSVSGMLNHTTEVDTSSITARATDPVAEKGDDDAKNGMGDAFFLARPILDTIHNTYCDIVTSTVTEGDTEHSNSAIVTPALYSLPAIKKEFLRVLQIHHRNRKPFNYHEGRRKETRRMG